MHHFTQLFSASFWLPKIPLLSFVGLFVLPLILIEVNYDIGLFFIAFYISYWSVKIFQSYYHVIGSYYRLLQAESYSWNNDIAMQGKTARDLQHIVIVPIYTEPYDVIAENIESLLAVDYPYRSQITILLATEARAPEGEKNAQKIIQTYGKQDIEIVSIVHPENLPNEGKVKGANITYAIKTYESLHDLDPKSTFVSTIDTDTKVQKDFFSIITTTFLSTDHRDQAIYQYTPIYSNNWRTGYFFARIVSIGTTMWQLLESQNPEFYRNFAVYGQSLLCLHKADYWDRHSIVEDGMQYWRSYFGWGGQFRIINTPAICEMDLVAEKNLYRTVRSQYKQLRRWSWGCSDVEYVIPKALAMKTISAKDKFRKIFYLIQNHLFWSSGPFMIFFIGYVPGIFASIDHSLAVFTVPIASSLIFTILFATVIIPSILSIHIMRRYTSLSLWDYIRNLVQWICVPILALTLYSIPAIESQVRLFFGKRIDSFDTTQKMARK